MKSAFSFFGDTSVFSGNKTQDKSYKTKIMWEVQNIPAGWQVSIHSSCVCLNPKLEFTFEFDCSSMEDVYTWKIHN